MSELSDGAIYAQVSSIDLMRKNEELKQENEELKAHIAEIYAAKPFSWCFTDVNGKPTRFSGDPSTKSEQDKRVYTPLYVKPVLNQSLALHDVGVIDKSREEAIKGEII